MAALAEMCKYDDHYTIEAYNDEVVPGLKGEKEDKDDTSENNAGKALKGTPGHLEEHQQDSGSAMRLWIRQLLEEVVQVLKLKKMAWPEDKMAWLEDKTTTQMR
jgi:hypothetical protein